MKTTTATISPTDAYLAGTLLVNAYNLQATAATRTEPHELAPLNNTYRSTGYFKKAWYTK